MLFFWYYSVIMSNKQEKSKNPDLISIAPMLDWTDRHFRYFLRLICHRPVFYTEMIAAPALVLGNREKLLAYHPAEHPLVLQVGGSDPRMMGMCANYAADMGYRGVNINAGCPSSRVQSGQFGAVLMKNPALVADCVHQMCQSGLPVSVKTRICLSDIAGDGFEQLFHFADSVRQAGCSHLIVHARKAKLNISPKENRGEKLPLNYELVYRLKKSFPDLTVSINGNVLSLSDIQTHLEHVDGVMIGRWAYGNPYALAEADNIFYHDTHPVLNRVEILECMLDYMRSYAGHPRDITRHLLGLYHGQPNAKAYKQAVVAGDLKQIEKFIEQQKEY